MQEANFAQARSSIDGLWVLLVSGDQPAQGSRIPMMARAGNDETYLLGFKTMHNARKFLKDSSI